MAKLQEGEQIIKEGISGEVMYRITRKPNTKSENGGWFYNFKIFTNYEWKGETQEGTKFNKKHIPTLKYLIDEIDAYFNAASEAYERRRGSGPNMNYDRPPAPTRTIAPHEQENLSAGRPEAPPPADKDYSFNDDDIPF